MTLKHRYSPLVWTLFGLAFLSLTTLVTPRYRLLYNASDSAPRGWYALVPEHNYPIGTLVVARLPSGAEALAAERGYLPRSVPLLKHVAAMRGDYVCSENRALTIDGVFAGHALERDGIGRPLNHWAHCRSLEEDELFVLGGDNPASFDSRYFGPVNVSSIIGRAIPLWTW